MTDNSVPKCYLCWCETKYTCIDCSLPVCLRYKCSTYEEKEEEAEGWKAQASVGYCKTCRPSPTSSDEASELFPEENRSSRFSVACLYESDDGPPSSPEISIKPLPKKQGKDSTKAALPPAAKKMKLEKKVPAERAIWKSAYVVDVVDIITSDAKLQKELIFTNTPNKKNSVYYENVIRQLSERMENYKTPEVCNLQVFQVRDKFKKCISYCKKVALTIKTATGISALEEDEEIGKWFKKLFPLVQSRESCQPEQALEPIPEPSVSPGSSSSDNSPGIDLNQFVPIKGLTKKDTKKEQVDEILRALKDIKNNDPVASFIEFAKEEAEKNRQHDMQFMKMMLELQQNESHLYRSQVMSPPAYHMPPSNFVPNYNPNPYINHSPNLNPNPSYSQEVVSNTNISVNSTLPCTGLQTPTRNT